MKRHPLDPFSLVAGLIVTIVALLGLIGPWRLEVGPWAWPAVLVLSGIVVLGVVLGRGRRAEPAAVGDDAGGHDPDRDEALAAAYAELDDDMTVDEPDPSPGG